MRCWEQTYESMHFRWTSWWENCRVNNHKQCTPNCLHFTNAASHKMLLIPLRCLIARRNQVDALNDLIMKQVVTKFGCLKIHNCGDTRMYSGDSTWWWQFYQFTAWCLIIDCIRAHPCISTVINVEGTKFCHDLLMIQNFQILTSIMFSI